MAAIVPTPETIELNRLLEPLPGDSPTGESLLYSDLFDQIADARKSGERSQFEPDGKQADWRKVVRLSTDALVTRTKDLQLAVWLAEALVRQHGFGGLRDGLKLVRELCDRYWDELHPRVEDGDLDVRAARLAWMNDEGEGRESIATLVRRVPVTPAGASGAFGWIDWRESREVDQLARRDPKKHAEAVESGRVTGERFAAAVASGRRAFYETLFADVTATLDECRELERVVAERFGKSAPSLYNLHHGLEECLALVEGILGEKRAQEPDVADLPGADTGNGADPDPGAAVAASPASARRAGGTLPLEPVDRADALLRLQAVAAFFRRTEPHSPIAYLVERAVRWSGMPLEAWLKEVLGSDDQLGRVRDVLGITEEDRED